MLQDRWESGRISHRSVELVGFGSQGTARSGPLLIDVTLDEAPASISAVFVLTQLQTGSAGSRFSFGILSILDA